MSVFYLGFSLADDDNDDDLEMKEGVVVQLKDDNRSEIKSFDFETEFDFCPIQHPTEPSHEDTPVQCPMPGSSHLINDERMQDDRFSERKRPPVVHKQNSTLEEATEVPSRTIRKRHHDHTNVIIPSMQTPPVVYPNLNPNMNTTVRL